MTSLPSAHYLDTRLSIMGAALLPESAFAELIAKPLDQGILATLGLTAPSGQERLPERTVENLLSQHLLHDLSVVLRPLSGTARDFFTYWARRFELFNLKTLIHGKHKGLPSGEIERHLEPTPSFAALPHERLLDTENTAELLRQIEAGPYGAIARQARRAMEKDQDTLDAEIAIDRGYFRGLVAQARRLPETDRSVVTSLLGCQLDRINLGWLMRYRFGYGMSPSESYYPLVRGGDLLGHEVLLKLVELKDLPSLLAALPPGLAERLHGARDSFTVELRLEALLYERAHAAFRQGRSTAGRALAYLILRDAQLRRLRAIIQGKRLGLPGPLIAHAAGLELH